MWGSESEESDMPPISDPMACFQYLLGRFTETGIGSGEISTVCDPHFPERRCIQLSLHTGGWSTCEEIIDALPNQFPLFWAMYWFQSQRGGHYTFLAPIKE
jgi:hypothetical protein